MKKVKFRNATEAKRYKEAAEYQQRLYKQWGISEAKLKKSSKEFKGNYTHRSTDDKIPSVSISGGIHSRKESKTYTGDLVIGVAVLHKSCLQPVINQEQATEAARMRR